MRLFSGLSIGRESLQSHGTALTAVADNVSNSSTTGYKAERPNFGDILAASTGALFGPDRRTNPGNGSKITGTSRDLTQGPVELTSRPLDAAIEGNGYFTLASDATSTERFYTRAGNFIVDKSGQLQTEDGNLVLGYTTASPDTPVPITLSFEGSGANPSTTMVGSGNLDARAPIAAVPANPATYAVLNAATAFTVPTTVIDTLGGEHNVILHYFHTGQGAWSVQPFTDGAETGGTADTPVALGAAVAFTFDANGQIPEGTAVNLNIAATWAGTGATSAIVADLSNFTGYAASSYVANIEVNGNRPGAVIGTKFDEAGNIFAVLDNGESVSVGNFALSNFDSQTGLDRVGNNTFRGDADKVGDISTGRAGSGGRGSIKPGSLENSNVDLASQFVDIIKYQRGYQASSQVIQTFNDVINTTINIA